MARCLCHANYKHAWTWRQLYSKKYQRIVWYLDGQTSNDTNRWVLRWQQHGTQGHTLQGVHNTKTWHSKVHARGCKMAERAAWHLRERSLACRCVSGFTGGQLCWSAPGCASLAYMHAGVRVVCYWPSMHKGHVIWCCTYKIKGLGVQNLYAS